MNNFILFTKTKTLNAILDHNWVFILLIYSGNNEIYYESLGRFNNSIYTKSYV